MGSREHTEKLREYTRSITREHMQYYPAKELLEDIYAVIDAQDYTKREKTRWKKKFRQVYKHGNLNLPDLPPEWAWRLCSANLMRGKFRWWGWECRSLWSMQLKTQQWKYRRWTPGMQSDRLLVLAEQGLGDEVLFSSLISDLRDVCPDTRITYEADDRLLPILRRTHPGIDFITRYKPFATWDDRIAKRVDSEADYPEGVYDAFIPSGDLCPLFRSSKNSWPGVPFLKVNEELRYEWANKLAGHPRPLVGIAWAGRAGEHDPAILEEGTAIQCQYSNPKHGWAPKKESSALDIGVDWHTDIDDSLAVLDCLDWVNSVCNTLVHLAGSIGCRVNVVKQDPSYGEGVPNSYKDANNQLRWVYGSGNRMRPYKNVRVYRNSTEWKNRKK